MVGYVEFLSGVVVLVRGILFWVWFCSGVCVVVCCVVGSCRGYNVRVCAWEMLLVSRMVVVGR